MAATHARFQFTRPHWGATKPARRSAATTCRFNSRARTGARLPGQRKQQHADMFQFTRPHWGATRHPVGAADQDSVSIHAPALGRDGKLNYDRDQVAGFNSRARTGARLPARVIDFATVVSIHAPALGRDSRRSPSARRGAVSIHAPALGRDLDRLDTGGLVTSFNSRARTGARQGGATTAA